MEDESTPPSSEGEGELASKCTTTVLYHYLQLAQILHKKYLAYTHLGIAEAQQLVPAVCDLENISVPLDSYSGDATTLDSRSSSSDLVLDYHPIIVRMPRCGGFCADSSMSCQPTNVTVRACTSTRPPWRTCGWRWRSTSTASASAKSDQRYGLLLGSMKADLIRYFILILRNARKASITRIASAHARMRMPGLFVNMTRCTLTTG